MKKISNLLLMGLISVLPLGFTACSEDDDDKAAFPETVIIECEAESEESYKFTANLDWKLSVDKSWVTLSYNSIEGQDLQGVAGTHEVTLKISEEGLEFAETSASLTMTMGLESRVVAKIVRAAEEYDLYVQNEVGNTVDTISIDNSGSIAFVVGANFDFAATSCPEWLEISMDATEENTNIKNAYAMVVDSLSKNPQVGEIVFANENNDVVFRIPVKYAGMSPEEIEIGENTPWSWTVSMDGKTYTQESMMGGDPTTFTDGVTFNVKALNDDVKFYVAEESYDQLWITDATGSAITWMKATQDESNKEIVTVTVDEFVPEAWGPKERKGFIFAVPAAKSEEFAAGLQDGTSISFIDNNVNYVLMQFTQREASAGGISVKQAGWIDLEITEGVANEEINMFIQSNFSVTEIYSVNAGASSYLTICPLLSEADWAGDVNIYNGNGESVSAEQLGGSIEPGMNEAGQYYVSFSTPQTFDSPLIIIFRGTNWLNLKALVVNPQ